MFSKRSAIAERTLSSSLPSAPSAGSPEGLLETDSRIKLPNSLTERPGPFLLSFLPAAWLETVK